LSQTFQLVELEQEIGHYLCSFDRLGQVGDRSTTCVRPYNIRRTVAYSQRQDFPGAKRAIRVLQDFLLTMWCPYRLGPTSVVQGPPQLHGRRHAGILNSWFERHKAKNARSVGPNSYFQTSLARRIHKASAYEWKNGFDLG